LTDLETAERVLMRVSKTPPARRTRSATARVVPMPTVSVKFRRADPIDKEVIQRINADAYIPPYMAVLGTISKPVTEDYGTRIEKGEVWILDVEGEPTGVAVIEERADHMLIYSIAVKPDAQRKGYGTTLLDFADHEPSVSGCAKFGSTPTSGWKETCDFIADTALLRLRNDHIQVGLDRCWSIWSGIWTRLMT
jgi:GNAT superfamily N-acetyltransferase